MRRISTHIPSLSSLVLALFVIANSGFTVVLYHCTICDQTAAASCCADQSVCGPEGCPMADTPRPSGAALDGSSMPCLVMVVAGGVQTAPTIVEKETRSTQNRFLQLLPVVMAPSAADPCPHTPFSSLAHARMDDSPPSVEKYILNASLLL